MKDISSQQNSKEVKYSSLTMHPSVRSQRAWMYLMPFSSSLQLWIISPSLCHSILFFFPLILSLPLSPILPLFHPLFSHISQSSPPPISIPAFFPRFDSPSFPTLSFSLPSYLSTLPLRSSCPLCLSPSLPSSRPFHPSHPYTICPSLA